MLMESNLMKLNSLYQRGGESFANQEAELKKMLLEKRRITQPATGIN
jgi:hypothetical protein